MQHGTPQHDDAWAREAKRGLGLGPIVFLAGTGVLALALMVVLWVGLSTAGGGGGGGDISPADRSATAEARQFATAEVQRAATAQAAIATQTAYGNVTSTAVTVAAATGAARAASTTTAAALQTAQAPPTLTARAVAFAREEAEAAVAVAALDSVAVPVQEPLSDLLDPAGEQAGPICLPTSLQLRNFIVSATFSNPPAPRQEAWDYGFSLDNVGQPTHYALFVRSEGDWFFQLASAGFSISYRDDSPLIDVSEGGSNTIKLYVHDGEAIIYINERYLTRIDLRMMGMSSSANAEHSPGICSALGANAVPVPTTFEQFSVWRLP